VSVGAGGVHLASAINVSANGSNFVAVRVTKTARLKWYQSGAISGTDRPNAILAFNGAFNPGDAGNQTGMQRDGVYLGGTIANGMAAVVGCTDGRFAVGQLGRDVPPAGCATRFVRTNLHLLVDGGAAVGSAGDPNQWGVPLASVGMFTARSAVGVDRDGNLLYVGSMATYPSTLAQVLVSVGAVRAMQLDINPWWVMAFAYSGGGTNNLVQNPNHPGDVFASGWSRDFFVATTR
jgi:hypothetical protein